LFVNSTGFFINFHKFETALFSVEKALFGVEKALFFFIVFLAFGSRVQKVKSCDLNGAPLSFWMMAFIPIRINSCWELVQIDLLEMEDKTTKHALYLCDSIRGNLIDKHWVFNMLLVIFPLDDLDITQTRLTSKSHQKLQATPVLQSCLLFWAISG